jgi:hypothetical protein
MDVVREGTDRMNAVTSATPEIDGDDTSGSPFSFAGETVYADDVRESVAHAPALKVEPVKGCGGVQTRAGDAVRVW